MLKLSFYKDFKDFLYFFYFWSTENVRAKKHATSSKKTAEGPKRILCFLGEPLFSLQITMPGHFVHKGKQWMDLKEIMLLKLEDLWVTDFLICFQNITANSTTAGVQNLSTEQKLPHKRKVSHH